MKKIILLMLFSVSATFAANEECKTCDQFYGWYNVFRYACRQTNKTGPEFRKDIEAPLVMGTATAAVAAVVLPAVGATGPIAGTASLVASVAKDCATVTAAVAAAVAAPTVVPAVIPASVVNAEAAQAVGVAGAGVASWWSSGKKKVQETAKAGGNLVALGVGNALGAGPEVVDAIANNDAVQFGSVIAGAAVVGTTCKLTAKAIDAGVDMLTGKSAALEQDRKDRAEQSRQLVASNMAIAEAQREASYYSEQNVKGSEQVFKSNERLGARLEQMYNNPEKLLQFPDEKKE